MVFFVVKAGGFYSCYTGKNFCGITIFIGRKGNEGSSDFIGLNNISSAFYATKAHSTDSTTTGERNIDTVHCSEFLKMFIILCDKASEFFSCGVFDNDVYGHGGAK
jgi:hypothetical protein